MGVARSSEVGLTLQRYRRLAHLTQEDLAERAGVSVRAISDIERGVRQPRRDTLRLLLDALELSEPERNAVELSSRGDAGARVDAAARRPGGFLGARPPGPLVARRFELERIQAFIDTVKSGIGQVVMLEGEPGIGKTRLAQEADYVTRQDGFIVTSGRCYEPDRSVPYFPFLEAMAGLVASTPPLLREAIPRQWPHLAWLLPDPQLPAPPRERGDDQQRVQWAVTGYIRAVTEIAPVALLLDDLQWADPSSLRLLSHLARHTRDYPVLLLATYRSEDLDPNHPVSRALIDLNRERLLEQLTIGRLDEEGTAALISSMLGNVETRGELTSFVHEYTGGNPFFVQEVLRTLIEQGDLYRRDGHWTRRGLQEMRVPETVQAVLDARLARLGADTQEVLRQASVLGQVFTVDRLFSMSSLDEATVDAALDEAETAGVIRATGGRNYTFDHALVQGVLYAGLPARRRQRLHSEAARALQSETRPRATEIARHLVEGDAAVEALPYLMRAGQEAEDLFAHEEAVGLYRTVVRISADLADSLPEVAAIRADATAHVGRVLHVTEQYDEALEMLEEAARLYRALGSEHLEARMVSEIGWLHHARGTSEEGLARVRPMVEELERDNEGTRPSESRPPGNINVLAALHTALARLYFGLGEFERELDAAERASELARLSGDQITLAVADTRRGAVLAALGREAEALEVLEVAASLAEVTHNSGTQSSALQYIGEIYLFAAQIEESRERFEQALHLVTQTDVPRRIATVTARLGRVAAITGDWAQAHELFSRAMTVDDSQGRSSPYLFPMLLDAQLCVHEGRWAEASRVLDTVAQHARPGSDRWILQFAAGIRAQKAIFEGVPDLANELLTPILARNDVVRRLRYTLLVILAEAAIDAGRIADAETALTTMTDDVRGWARMLLPDVLCLQARVLTLRGNLEAAETAFQQAIAAATAIPYPYARARALYHQAATYDAGGKPEAAREATAEFERIFEQLGARAHRLWLCPPPQHHVDVAEAAEHNA